jgi:hypothetical protein
MATTRRAVETGDDRTTYPENREVKDLAKKRERMRKGWRERGREAERKKYRDKERKKVQRE